MNVSRPRIAGALVGLLVVLNVALAGLLLVRETGPATRDASPSARATSTEAATSSATRDASPSARATSTEPATSSAPSSSTAADPSSGTGSDAGPTKTASPKAGSPSEEEAATREQIDLVSQSYVADPNETISIDGRFTTARGPTALRIQRREGGRWVSFPLPTTTDDSGGFRAYIELGRPGTYELRLLDPESRSVSEVFAVRIG